MVDDNAVQDFLEILEEHRKNCERQGKYMEAEIAKNRLDELRLHDENRKREIMRSKQISERIALEEAHMLEFQQFNTDWDNTMTEYETKSEGLVVALKEKHICELKDFLSVASLRQTKPKFSKELLNLRKIQETLARNKEYAEAQKMKSKADTLEQYELSKWEELRNQDRVKKESLFKYSKQQELFALQKRIQSGREEQKKQRHIDLERLLKRYQNAKAELEAQQNLERSKMERLFQTGNSMSKINK